VGNLGDAGIMNWSLITVRKCPFWLMFAAFFFLFFSVSAARSELVFLGTLASFNGTNGAQPQSPIIQGADGSFYGTTSSGGLNGLGTVFRITADGTLTTLHSFGGGADGGAPLGGLTQGPDGKFYGTTSGGTNGFGTVFKITPDGTFANLVAFNGLNGASPSGALAQDQAGNFYGTTQQGGDHGYGTVFKVTTAGNLTVLYSFGTLTNSAGSPEDGAQPVGGLLLATDGNFYGTTSDTFGATVFKVTPQGALSILFSLPGPANQPLSTLVEGRDGALYGTCSSGVIVTVGTVFKVNKDGSGYAVLKDFQGSQLDGANPVGGLVEGRDGVLYGTASSGGVAYGGLVFRLNADGTAYTVLHEFTSAGGDGANPRSTLIQGRDGALYGTTLEGGEGGVGTVFKLTLGFTVLRSFSGSSGDGANPASGLIQGYDGALYGATFNGGSANFGTAFKLNRDASGYSVLHSFGAPAGDGVDPAGALLQSDDGTFYGITSSGGIYNMGTVFRLQADGSGYVILKSFTNVDGANPSGGLIQARDRAFYGTTASGGTNGQGTVFRINADTNGYEILRNFAGPDGANPQAPLLQGVDGALYGSTSSGGTGVGSIFKVNTDGSGFTILYSFTGGLGDGANPLGGLLQGQDGVLYGVTANGGNNNAGIVFKLNTNGSGYAVLKSFSPLSGDGSNPHGALVQGRDGILYGTTYSGGARGLGSIFKLGTDGNGFTNLYSFTGSTGDGSKPRGALMWASDGTLFGTTEFGGTNNAGAIFQLAPDTSPANDNFAQRVPLPGADPADAGNNFGATLELSEPAHGGSFAFDVKNSVWWSWTAPTNGPVSVLTEGSTFDPVIDVYTGNTLDALSGVADNLDTVLNTEAFPTNIANARLQNRVGFSATAGTTYQIAVCGFRPGSIGISVQPIGIHILSLTQSTNSDLTVSFSAQVQIGNAGLTPSGPLRLRAIATPGYSFTLSYGPPALPSDQGLTTNTFGNPANLAPGMTTNLEISGVCPAPIQGPDCLDNRSGIGWGVFILLEERVGEDDWLLEDRDLLLYGVWPCVNGYGGVGGGVIRLNPGLGGSQPRCKSVTISGPSSVLQGGSAAYSGVARFNNGLTHSFTNASWTASLFSVDSNGIFQAESVISNTPVTLTCYYSYGGDQYSNQKTITVIRTTPPSIMTVRTNGHGTVTPNLDGKPLTIGKRYTITARTGSGYLFVNWTGSLTTNRATLAFIMQSNMFLQANFIPIPFTAVRGSYSGLFYDTNRLGPASSGSFVAIATDKGSYSGKIQIAGKSYSITGSFDFTGKAVKTLNRFGLPPLIINLQIDLSGSGISGVASDGVWTATLLARRTPFSLTANPCPYSGKYTIALLNNGGNESLPQGDGWASVTIDRGGRASFAGALADGTRILQSTSLSQAGQAALYSSLYTGQGSVQGWLNFGTPTSSGGYGSVNWSKSASAAMNFYPAGFTNDVQVLGSLYAPPTLGARILNWGTGIVAFDGGGLVEPFTNRVTLGLDNRIVNTSSNKLSMTFTTLSGMFKGSVTAPGGTTSVPFQGILLQKWNVGYGYFLNPTQSGSVWLGPE
jgi:uncharacterized repeat protein (TIGR03803 family)